MKFVYGLIFLCFLVFFHELGHFIAARFFKVKVLSFSIGMGPVLFHKMIKGTDYRLSLLPLGGYCGMKGEKDFSTALEAKLSSIPAEKDSLYGIHPLKRAAVAFAGPFFNLLFAFAAFTAISMIGFTYYAPSAKIVLADEVYPEIHSAARDAGIQTGDTILQVNSSKVNDFSDIATFVAMRPDEDILVKVERNGGILTFTVHTDMDKADGAGKIGVTSTPNSVEKREMPTCSFFPALVQGTKSTAQMIALSIKSIAILFKGVDIQNAVSGPARITSMLGDTVEEGFSAGFRVGFVNTLQFLALISISLFMLNLLPIPILDGGLILFSFIEMIIHRQVPPKIQYYVQYVGLAFIIMLFLVGVFGDIHYFISTAGAK